MLFVGATLKDHAASGGHGSQHFEHTSDSEMTILVQADVWGAQENAVCRVYAVDEQWEKMTLDIPLQLSKAPAVGSSLYIPDHADAVPGITVGNATVTATVLGYTVRYMETITDEEACCNIKKVEFDGLTYGDGGTVLEDDGNWYLTVSGCTGDVGDTLIARYYDWDDQEIGAITFHKQS